MSECLLFIARLSSKACNAAQFCGSLERDVPLPHLPPQKMPSSSRNDVAHPYASLGLSAYTANGNVYSGSMAEVVRDGVRGGRRSIAAVCLRCIKSVTTTPPARARLRRCTAKRSPPPALPRTTPRLRPAPTPPPPSGRATNVWGSQTFVALFSGRANKSSRLATARINWPSSFPAPNIRQAKYAAVVLQDNPWSAGFSDLSVLLSTFYYGLPVPSCP